MLLPVSSGGQYPGAGRQEQPARETVHDVAVVSQAASDGRDGLRMLTLAQAAHNGPWELPPLVRAEAQTSGTRVKIAVEVGRATLIL